MGKQAALFDLLKRPVGTTIAALSKASGWQQHSVREILGRRGPQVARTRIGRGIALAAALFYSDVRDLIQTVQVGPGLTQTQNVGDGHYYGFELSAETALSQQVSVGGNYTYIYRTIKDPLQPNLRPTGVPTHKAFLYVSWRPIERLTITPSLEIASDRWSDVSTNPVQALPYVLTGAYTLANIQASYKVTDNFEVAGGVKNLLDQNFELAWGLPQPGRTFYVKARATF